jgi:hypothetical protein
MNYEISREMFKQRLEDKLNFVFIDVSARPLKLVEGCETLAFSNQFADQIQKKYPNKNSNILLFSFYPEDSQPTQAAEALTQAGYNFVYFYSGSDQDLVLDKGLN